MCPSTPEEQSKFLYDLLQDNLQEEISCKDKDIPEVIKKIIQYSTVMIY